MMKLSFSFLLFLLTLSFSALAQAREPVLQPTKTQRCYYAFSGLSAELSAEQLLKEADMLPMVLEAKLRYKEHSDKAELMIRFDQGTGAGEQPGFSPVYVKELLIQYNLNSRRIPHRGRLNLQPMKKLLLLMVPLLGTKELYSQADGCSAATTLPVTAVCSPLAGTTLGATQTIPGCSGNADDDVWYKFTATSTSQQITVNASAGFDAVLQLFSGPCNTLVSLVCKDDNFSGQPEVINYSGFTVGATYTLRVYHYGPGSGTGNFDICVTQAPAPPLNNNCSGAAPLAVNTTCIPTAGTTVGATPSLPGCAGNADDDVWYSFVATNAVQTITVNP